MPTINSAVMVNLQGKLEPEARNQPTNRDAAQLSIAISMKRIADVLDQNLGANAWGHEGALNGILQQINLNGRT